MTSSPPLFRILCSLLLAVAIVWGRLHAAEVASDATAGWEITPESEAAIDRGLRWLAANQGPGGNWGSNDLGLVAVGALAFLSAGHLPGIGEHGEAC